MHASSQGYCLSFSVKQRSSTACALSSVAAVEEEIGRRAPFPKPAAHRDEALRPNGSQSLLVPSSGPGLPTSAFSTASMKGSTPGCREIHDSPRYWRTVSEPSTARSSPAVRAGRKSCAVCITCSDASAAGPLSSAPHSFWMASTSLPDARWSTVLSRLKATHPAPATKPQSPSVPFPAESAARTIRPVRSQASSTC